MSWSLVNAFFLGHYDVEGWFFSLSRVDIGSRGANFQYYDLEEEYFIMALTGCPDYA